MMYDSEFELTFGDVTRDEYWEAGISLCRKILADIDDELQSDNLAGAIICLDNFLGA